VSLSKVKEFCKNVHRGRTEDCLRFYQTKRESPKTSRKDLRLLRVGREEVNPSKTKKREHKTGPSLASVQKRLKKEKTSSLLRSFSRLTNNGENLKAFRGFLRGAVGSKWLLEQNYASRPRNPRNRFIGQG